MEHLKGCISKLAFEEQATFVLEHIIFNNIVQESAHYLETISIPDSIIIAKLDMERVYNRMGWEFVYKVLHVMGFNNKWIG